MAIFSFYPDEPCAIEIGLKIVPILIPSSFFARQLSRLSIINNIIITAKTIMPEIVNIAISSLIILAPVLSVSCLARADLHGGFSGLWKWEVLQHFSRQTFLMSKLLFCRHLWRSV